MPVLGPGGFFRLAWTEWGPEKAPERTVICVHGLTRNGRDFDALARALAEDGWRVVCPDMPGRGKSDWLGRADDYSYPIYTQTVAALYARLDVPKVDWIGTSMGGLIGMLLAAQRGHFIRKLVLNDIGPFVPAAALQRIGEYCGRDPRFQDFEEVEAYLREVHKPFGELSDAEWMHLALHSAEESEEGNLRLRYDPAIGKPFAAASPRMWCCGRSGIRCAFPCSPCAATSPICCCARRCCAWSSGRIAGRSRSRVAAMRRR